MAIRIIANTFTDPKMLDSEYVKNADDFKLYRVAEFDDSMGHVESSLELLIELARFKFDLEQEDL